LRREASHEPKFLTNSMHGKLTHWLRMLGYDTIYYPKTDNEIIDRAAEERRVVLTSDTELHRRVLSRGGLSILLPLSGTEAQLSHIAHYLETHFDTPHEEFLTVKFRLCSLCNGRLKPLQGDRWKCEDCGQEYWVGGHWRNISRVLERARELVNKLSNR